MPPDKKTKIIPTGSGPVSKRSGEKKVFMFKHAEPKKGPVEVCRVVLVLTWSYLHELQYLHTWMHVEINPQLSCMVHYFLISEVVILQLHWKIFMFSFNYVIYLYILTLTP